MRIALVHDWLTGMRGGEKCLDTICSLFPKADLFTLLHIKGTVSKQIESRKIYTSFLQYCPMIKNNYRYYLPLMPIAIERFNLQGYDLIISSSHCVAKGIKKGYIAKHICYCFTPMRYIWDMYSRYFSNGRGGVFTKMGIRLLLPYLRKWDVSSSRDVDYFIAISNNVSERILRHYNTNSTIIYPPVDTSYFLPQDMTDDYFLIVSAYAPYKNIELAIEAFNILGIKLKIAGSGYHTNNIKAEARSNIEFLGRVSDPELRELYARCRALIFPGEEDFGITPLEAQSAGRPVIAYGRGGVLETVKPAVLKDARSEVIFNPEGTGIFFYQDTVPALVEAIKQFEQIEYKFNKKDIRYHALKFDKSVFLMQFKKFIEKNVGCIN